MCNCKLVSSILSTLSLPRLSILAPDPSTSSSSPSPPPPPPPPQHSDALCGSCPSNGSAPQPNGLWPTLPPSSTTFPSWPALPNQPNYPSPCWPGQPNTPCWPGTQPAPYSVPVQALGPAPGQPCQPYWPGSQCQPTSLPSPYVPYNLNLARGVYDKMMMTILGHVKPNAKMFTVNFLRGTDIAFHINPRFCEGGKQVLVRNHKLGERWGPEERELKPGPFPFALGSPFEMKILCNQEAFRVAVNNIPLFEFRHRIRALNQIDRINILHDVVLTYVNVETLP
uniref:Galectin n=1 Tax=Labrus bergylta TaxID=56723 RepID=A0A3Q3NH10_9LABR